MKKHQRILKKYDGQKLLWFRFSLFFGGLLIVMLLLFGLIIGVSFVDGQSMMPTYKNGDMLVFSRLSKNPEKGDVVYVRMASGEKYIKRVLASEGDIIDLRDGKFLVNGEEIMPERAHGRTEPQESTIVYPYTIPAGHYFVLGDNREVSIDSRTFGAIARSQIRGIMFSHK